jgi:hypothetical protein
VVPVNEPEYERRLGAYEAEMAQLREQSKALEEEVISLLGRPSESNSVNVLGVSGTASRWVAGDIVVTVRFVNGKVAFKSFDKAGDKAK